MNSFIYTPTGLSLVIDAQPHTVQREHPYFDDIIEALKRKKWSEVAELIDLKSNVKKQLATMDEGVVVSADGVITVDGHSMPAVLGARLGAMLRDGFDVSDMVTFFRNLQQNPSYRAKQELYGWMEKNGLTITPDGHFLAWKRVNDDYTSMYDSKTMNAVGTYVQMNRNEVDDRSENTCSVGLHFCAQSYLPHYGGGRGRVLLLKINPADVVSIPTDYNFAKGRACKYFVVSEAKGEARQTVEQKELLTRPSVQNVEDVNVSSNYQNGYAAGYRDGRGKKARFKSYAAGDLNGQSLAEYRAGYDAGHTDGRNRQPKKFDGHVIVGTIGGTVAIAVTAVCEAMKSVCDVNLRNVTPTDRRTLSSFGVDDLDFVEMVLFIEDEYGIDVDDDFDLNDNATVGSFVQHITKAMSN